MTSAPPRRTGTVVWVDLSTTDVEGAIHFYERLLRWRYEEVDAPTGSGAGMRISRIPSL